MRRSDIAVYDVFCGIDVGNAGHYAVALDRDGDEFLWNGPVAQDEAAIREALASAGRSGQRMLVTVDQNGGFGGLVVAVAKDMGLDVAHLPPRRFSQAAQVYGEDKTDANDAFVIADVSRSAPRHIELVGERSEVAAQVRVLASCRDDGVRERTRCYNRLHDLLHRVCPALDGVLSKKKLHNGLEIRLVARYGGPQGLKRAGKARATRWAAGLKYCGTRGPRLVEAVFDALAEQTVSLPAASVIEAQIKRIAGRVIELEAEERELDAELERLSGQLIEVRLLRSIPGIGCVLGATIAAEIGDIGRLANAHHLASYAGVAPVKRESGTIKKSRKRKGGNRRLKKRSCPIRDHSSLQGRIAGGGLLREEDRRGQDPPTSMPCPGAQARRGRLRDAGERHALRTAADNGVVEGMPRLARRFAHYSKAVDSSCPKTALFSEKGEPSLLLIERHRRKNEL